MKKNTRECAAPDDIKRTRHRLKWSLIGSALGSTVTYSTTVGGGRAITLQRKGEWWEVSFGNTRKHEMYRVLGEAKQAAEDSVTNLELLGLVGEGLWGDE